jgi:hypothetical protein
VPSASAASATSTTIILDANPISVSKPSTTREEPAALSHAQLVWSYALEWCESQGVEGAVNPKDADGTPSYYSWQWKPSTFRYFGALYGVLASTTPEEELLTLMRDYDTERAVIEAMIAHRSEIVWGQQFPACTRKLGLPPA